MKYSMFAWEASQEGRHRKIQSASIVWNNHLQNGHQHNDVFDNDDEKTIDNPKNQFLLLVTKMHKNLKVVQV